MTCLRHRSRRYIRPSGSGADNGVNNGVVAAVSSHGIVQPPINQRLERQGFVVWPGPRRLK